MPTLLMALLWVTGAWPAFSQTSPVYAWTNFAGHPGGPGNVDGTGSAARFGGVCGMALDRTGNLFVVELGGTIRRVTPAGVVTTVAGSAGQSGSVDGLGSAARFYWPWDVAADRADNLIVADTMNNTIRKVTPAGVVTPVAGKAGACGSVDGPGSEARFNSPRGVAVDRADNVFVADFDNHTIRKLTPAGVVTTLAGRAGVEGTNDGPGTAALFSRPRGVAVDRAGNVFVADENNHTIRKVTPTGVVTTLAGSAGKSGQADGVGSAARFSVPWRVAVDPAGNLIVAEAGNVALRRVTPARVVTTFAGEAGKPGSTDSPGDAARFNQIGAVALNSAGDVFMSLSDYTIRKVTPGGGVTTLAGSPRQTGATDGAGSAVRFDSPSGVAVDGAGNLFVADEDNMLLRKVSPAGVVTTVRRGADHPGREARFNHPASVAVDIAGNLFVAERGSCTILKVTPAGVVTTLAGSAGAAGTNDGPGGAARFNHPCGVAVDRAGNVFVADTDNCTIRKVTPDGVVTTLAGTAGPYYAADGTGSAARFSHPEGLAVDGASNVFVADTYNCTIRKVTPDGVVTTLAGSPGKRGGIDGQGDAAQLNYPRGVVVDSTGNVFVAGSHTIRMVTPAGVVTTIGGVADVMDGRDGVGSAARFAAPSGIAVDKAGNLYVADTANNRITKGSPVYR